MKAKHTPGPWKQNEDTGMNDSGVILDHIGTVIVTDIYGRTDEEAEANANLIAAAPDLLAALEAAVKHISLIGTEVGNMLEAAIAKARGGA